jgi:hypothetical protein
MTMPTPWTMLRTVPPGERMSPGRYLTVLNCFVGKFLFPRAQSLSTMHWGRVTNRIAASRRITDFPRWFEPAVLFEMEILAAHPAAD